MITSNDPHVKLLRKAFGDLDTRPFAWCFDEPSTAETPAAAPQEPRAMPVEGETHFMTGDEFLAMLRRSIGMPEE